MRDRYGLELTTSSVDARDAYVAGCDGVLAAGGNEIVDLKRAVDLDPRFAVAWVALARAHFLAANVAEAREAAGKARALADSTSQREQAHVNALCLGMEGKAPEALAATRIHLSTSPRDTMVAAPATGVFGLIGFSGRPDRESEQIELLEKLKPHLADDWWFQMVWAFALEETGRLDEAGREIERSLQGNPRSAHAAHIKAHVLYERGEDRAALDYLDGWLSTYPRHGLMHCHMSWHVAMFALSLGRTDRAWRVYREQVHPGGSWGPFLNTSTDSASFLWRAELAGEQRQAELWRELREYALRFFPKAGIAFADLHCALACIASGDDANLQRIVQEMEGRLASERYPAGAVVPALVAGFSAYEKGDWPKAIQLLKEARDETVRIGGSRAQRDLAEHTLIAACVKDGRLAEATELIASCADRRPAVPVAGLAAG